MSYKHLRFLLIVASNVKSKTDLSLVNNTSDIFTTNWQNGRYLYQQTKFADSIIYLQKAYENAVQQDNQKQQIKTLNLMSMSYQKLGEYQSSGADREWGAGKRAAGWDPCCHAGPLCGGQVPTPRRPGRVRLAINRGSV